ncbi:MAG: DUF1801 domain-containing protein [Bacteroidetes bacterium]|nr:DUF1801 domain-containing protein [Bacteroidota bacterium]
METNYKVDNYLLVGCGRCSLGGTPQCRVHTWQQELNLLRSIFLNCMLVEELKWGVPCYTYNKKNIVIVGALKEYCSIGFFKGALLQDEHKILSKPGENSQSTRIIRFTKVDEIIKLEPIVRAYIFEAIEIENAGLKVALKKAEDHFIPDEFQSKLLELPDLKTAFYKLTPGRQRAYLLHFSAPKQSITRTSRIEKCIPQILSGIGFNEDYKRKVLT